MRQFRIRDLLAVVALCAVCLAWWLDRRKLAADLYDTQLELESCNVEMTMMKATKQYKELTEEAERVLKSAEDVISNEQK